MITTNHNTGQVLQEGSELQEDGKDLEGINDELNNGLSLLEAAILHPELNIQTTDPNALIWVKDSKFSKPYLKPNTSYQD